MVMRVKEARRQIWEKAKLDDSITKRGDLFALNDPKIARYALQPLNVSIGEVKKVLSKYLFEMPFDSEIDRNVAVIEVATKNLSKMIRYERHAVNMRDKALRELEQIRTEGHGQFGCIK